MMLTLMYELCGKLFLQTDDGRKITRNYNKMASVLLEYEASFCFNTLLLFGRAFLLA